MFHIWKSKSLSPPQKKKKKTQTQTHKIEKVNYFSSFFIISSMHYQNCDCAVPRFFNFIRLVSNLTF